MSGTGFPRAPPKLPQASRARTDIPRRAATQCLPWESAYHAFHHTKMAAGARIDMEIGEWNKKLLLEELETTR